MSALLYLEGTADEPDCMCPPEHSITKLGHSRCCPWFGRAMPPLPAADLRGCNRVDHTDGTPHDFEWATYADDHVTMGICRCGADEISHAMRQAS